LNQIKSHTRVLIKRKRKVRIKWNQSKKRSFARKPIPPALVVQYPKIRVIKLYNRFSQAAKKAGVLDWPKSTKEDPFENYGICSGHPMKELSPMLLGPVILNGQLFAKNIEDGWQGTKVWSQHLTNGKFDAKKEGFWQSGTKHINKYSMKWIPEWTKWSEYIRMSGLGKRRHFKIDPDAINANVPLFQYFEGQQLSYVEGRKKMYIPWYNDLVQQTEAYKYLKHRFENGISLNLLEFDGMARSSATDLPEPVTPESLRRFINDPKIIFGHGMVLAATLLGCKPWEDPNPSDQENS